MLSRGTYNASRSSSEATDSWSWTQQQGGYGESSWSCFKTQEGLENRDQKKIWQIINSLSSGWTSGIYTWRRETVWEHHVLILRNIEGDYDFSSEGTLVDDTRTKHGLRTPGSPQLKSTRGGYKYKIDRFRKNRGSRHPGGVPTQIYLGG